MIEKTYLLVINYYDPKEKLFISDETGNIILHELDDTFGTMKDFIEGFLSGVKSCGYETRLLEIEGVNPNFHAQLDVK